VNERIIDATVHGRYLAIPPAIPGPAPLLVGFHGYAEDAEIQLDRLRAIPESDRWLTVSIQALHPFYQRRFNQVVASWMTRQNREEAIADNLAYVAKCVGAVSAEWPVLPAVVFAGFSQGVAMAFRAAPHANRRVTGVIAVGGDVPPEIAPDALGKISRVLIARGTSDELYPAAQFARDQQRLRECSLDVRALNLNAGHEWSGDLAVAASDFLREIYSRIV
jgi:predicted esterase